MPLPYSTGLEGDTPPAGAIRAMVRSPGAGLASLSFGSPRIMPQQQQRPTMDMPPPDLPQPKWQAAPTLGDSITTGIKTIGDIANRAKGNGTITNLDDAIKDLQKQHKDFYEALGKLKSGTANSYAAPADQDTYLRGIRASESGFNDEAVNKETGAAGRYQFLPTTAKDLMPELDLADLKKPHIQEELMKRYTDRSRSILEPMLGRKPTAGELYMLHFLGHAGGPQVLQNLDMPIEQTIGQAARDANKTFLAPYKTGRQLLAGLNSKFGQRAGE